MVELTGERVVLRPLTPGDADGLARASRDGEVWRSRFTVVPPPEHVDEYLRTALARRELRTELPFSIRIRHTDEIVGSTRFVHADATNRSIEISHIWLAQSWQRTFVNRDANALMLGYAFETLGCVRVQFRCDELNTASHRAFVRIGAVLEGRLRNERIMPDGRIRNTLLFSITDGEWPAARQRLDDRRRHPA